MEKMGFPANQREIKHLYILNSPTIYFLEDNVDKVRTAFESHLIPLGFTVTVDEQMTDNEGKLTWIIARNPTYGISASAYIRDSKRSSFDYGTDCSAPMDQRTTLSSSLTSRAAGPTGSSLPPPPDAHMRYTRPLVLALLLS